MSVDRLQNPYWPSKTERYAQNRIEGMNMQDAANAANLPHSVAKNAGIRMDPKGAIFIKDALEEVGGGSVHVAKAITAALNATKTYTGRDGMESTEHPDHKIRLDAAKLIAQVKGELQTNTAVQVNINLPDSWGSTWGAEEAMLNQPTLSIDANDIEVDKQ